MEDNEIATEVAKLQDRVEIHDRRLTEHGKQIDQLRMDGIAVRTELNNISAMLGEIKGDLKELKERPAQSWRDAVKQLMQLIIAAIFGYFFNRFSH